MTRTLACLVASMTVGATFLNWMKPARPTAASPGIELMARGPIESAWQGIDVAVCLPGDLPAANAHFLVYDNGDCTPTKHWQTQKNFGSEAKVRIALVASDSPEPITAVQRSNAMTLIRHLNDQYGIPGKVAIP